MKDERRASVLPETLPVIIFTVMGVKIALDTDQVAQVLEVDEADRQGLRIATLDEDLPFRGGPSTYDAPKVVVLKPEGVADALLVEDPEDIAEIPLDAIHPIPPVIAAASRSRGLWGVAIRGEDIILLVDVCKLGFLADASIGKGLTAEAPLASRAGERAGAREGGTT